MKQIRTFLDTVKLANNPTSTRPSYLCWSRRAGSLTT